MTLLDVATIIKPHGLSGEVVVHLLTNRTERLDLGTELAVRPLAHGVYPKVGGAAQHTLVVTAARPHKGRFLMRFEGVTTVDDAEALRGVGLQAEPIDDPSAMFVHDLLGKMVKDGSGTTYGTVTAVEANPASDLLVIDGKHYVPMRFVLEAGEHIIVDVPDGLFS